MKKENDNLLHVAARKQIASKSDIYHIYYNRKFMCNNTGFKLFTTLTTFPGSAEK